MLRLMAKYNSSWVQLALRGAPGAGPEATRQVVEATGVHDLGRHVRTLNAWAQLNPGAEDGPDYWDGYKTFALALMHEPHHPPEHQKPR
ncbi:MAG TPA: hypothetical protein VJ506_00490 [Candidatus Limnocylindrales bacterium]|nr:hypothetical protein [Candidatus Limnocylindrales bacterium]